MELSVLTTLEYKDSFKGMVDGRLDNYKVISNNAADKRMSIKDRNGVVRAIPYDEISGLEDVNKKGQPGKGKGAGEGKTPSPKPPEQEKKALPPVYKFEVDPLLTNDYEEELLNLIKAGIKNIWLVGPAGCGKTTITKNVAKKLEVGMHVISCGLGTSSSEFIGYKYPARETTPFGEYYAMPSIILLDEFTALDPAVAQISNSALANGFIMTTNGKIERHEDCIIIATSNTFGQGANRQYVANNQLDASTIDRFIGGILEMDYSDAYESQYDSEVYTFVHKVREIIKNNALRRIASTRMLIEGCKLKANNVSHWQFRLLSNWTKAELDLLRTDSTKNSLREIALSQSSLN